MKRASDAWRIISAVVLVAVIAFTFPLLTSITAEDIFDYTPESVPLAMISMWVIYAFKAATVFLPQVVLYVAAGIIFSPFIAIFVTIVGIVIELTVSYYIGRYLGKDRVVALLDRSRHGEKLLAYSREKGIYSAFLPRFIPTPTDLGSMLMGAVNMPYDVFLRGSLMGLLPRTIPIVLMGTAAEDPSSPVFWVSFLVIVVIYAAVFFVMYRRSRRNRREP